MDFIPDLGEPGIIDEIIYIGPLILQVFLLVVFFYAARIWNPNLGIMGRVGVAIVCVILSDIVLFVILMVAGSVLLN